jgi:hypothetical protein
MNRAIRILAFIASTYVIGAVLANIYLDWPIDMPYWLEETTMYMIRITGLGEVNNPDDAEAMATVIVACISWTLTGLTLWQLTRAVRRWRTRRQT